MAPNFDFFATCARGLEPALASELEALGVGSPSPRAGGVAFSGPLEQGYRAMLWLRSASRLLVVLRRFVPGDGDDLYAAVEQIDWSAQLSSDGTLAVDCVGSAPGLDHTRYAALRVKDAVVDQLRARHGHRPDVDTQDPGLRLNLHLTKEEATLSVDLGGGSLHRRGYRSPAARAPLRENLAAGLLLSAGWKPLDERAFCDPLCGSGTLVLEAALMAADVAPGLLRDGGLGSPDWLGHDRTSLDPLLAEARARDRRRRPPAEVMIHGSDNDASVLGTARASAARAGLTRWVQLDYLDVAERQAPASVGLLATNPPYGERIGEEHALQRLYLSLGETLKRRFGGWTAWVLAGNRELTRAIGLRATRRLPVHNGPIDCRWLCYPMQASATSTDLATSTDPTAPADASAPAKKQGRSDPDDPLQRVRRLLRDADAARMLANRLRKNEKRLGRWAAREGLEAYRVYDADLPEYATAIDRYGPALHVQEYAAPASVDARKAADRLHDTVIVAAEVLGVAPEHVHLKVRERQRGSAQYEKHEASGERFVVREGAHRFWVNLRDYLDTGLFLDHRPTRQLLGELAAGRRFLNLFCYTATATVYAAAGGATRSTSVDLSATYLAWARENYGTNGLGGGHELVQSDVLRWIEQAPRGAYDLIFCDPPTFSSSKRMEGTFDVQRDHVALLTSVSKLLAKGGVLVFSCNKRGFKLDEAGLAPLGFEIEDLGKRSLPQDFAKSSHIHRCFVLRSAAAGQPRRR